jgi:hypothetical protein
MDSGLSLRSPRNDGEGVASSARRANHRGLTSSPETKNISLYRNSDLRYQSAVLSPRRDVSRSSRYAGHGMRWTLWRQAGFSPDENVRSGRRNRVVLAPRPWRYLREVSSRTTGARKAASPGRARISRKTIARGKPGCLGCTCQIRVHSFATFGTRRCGRSQRPAFPAPSAVQRANELAKLRRNRAVRTRAHVFPRHCERSEAIRVAACGTMDCFVAEPVIGRAFARPVGSSQ